MKRAADLSKQLKDIQGMLRSGYGWLHNSTFWLLTIKNGRENEARAWLAKLVHDDGLVVSAARVGESASGGMARAGLLSADITPFFCARSRA